MRITVAGVGFVGLSMAVLLAQEHEVTAITTTEYKAEMLNDLRSPIKDDEIERFFSEAKEGRRRLDLKVTTDKSSAYSGAELVIIAAPTDYNEDLREFDTGAVEDAIEHALKICPDVPIVIKSTIPIGYTDKVRDRYKADNILFSPEFLRESKALYDNLHPSRIIVGAHEGERAAAEKFAAVLASAARVEEDREGLPHREIPVLIVSPAEAEAVKLFANAYLAARVSFFNELDTFAMTKGLDTGNIIKGVCLDPRIGDHYNNPSFGYGGYCLPKDTKQLLADYEGIPQSMMGAIVSSNVIRKQFIADDIKAEAPEVVGIYRLTMKTDSDNFRASAVQDIIRDLIAEGRKVIIYEPVLEDGASYLGGTVVNDPERFRAESDVIVANRCQDDALKDVSCKIYTRDLFRRD